MTRIWAWLKATKVGLIVRFILFEDPPAGQ